MRRLFFIVTFCFCQAVKAESLTFADEINLDRDIEKVFLITQFNNNKILVSGGMFRVLEQSQGNLGTRLELVGEVNRPDQSSAVNYSFLVLDTEGSPKATTIKRLDLSEGVSNSISADELRVQLQERQQVLKSVEVQRATQQENVERLQNDADELANVGRIVDVEDSLEHVKADSARMSRANELLTRDIENMKVAEAPRNFQRRMSDLTTQLSEITAAAKNAQAGESSRRVSAQSELQQKLSLIESTRNEHIDLLQNELAKLRRERELLERSRRVEH